MKTLQIVSSLLLLAAVGWSGLWAGNAESSRQPNILVFYVDDMGYLPGFTGGKLLDTPHMDKLARSGMIFTDGYVSASICGPSRVALLTGRYQARTGHDANSSRPGHELLLSETTMAQRLKKLGYHTGIVGKWHLGTTDERFLPTGRGFDFFVGHEGNINEGEENYYRGAQKVGRLAQHPLTSAIWANEATGYIRTNKDHPFFLYLAFNAVHTPLGASAEALQEFAHLESAEVRKYAAMTRELDDAIGKVMAELAAQGLEENTLVFLISDNGKAFKKGYEGDILRGAKWYLFEGGIRVPFAVSWKGQIAPGQSSNVPVMQLDVLPTAIAAAGVSTDPAWKLDGVNLLPLLTGQGAKIDRCLYWRFGTQYAIRDGQWKLVKALATVDRPMLFNLEDDIGEKNDLFAQHPDLVRQLQQKWDTWNSAMIPPRWIDKRWNRSESGELEPRRRVRE